MRPRLFFAVCILGLFGLSACSAPALPGDCADGRDNDNDGLIDYEDFGCEYWGGAVEADPAACLDGRDNDEDGLIDLDDYGCDSPDDISEDDPLRDCNDGVDNDADGFVDFPDDPGCDSPVDDDEYNPPACDDGVDNDGDGAVDFPLDPGCESYADEDETTPFPLPMCADGIDNDFDGLRDFPEDPGCESASDDNEYNIRIGECGPTVPIEDITAAGSAMNSIVGPMANELSSPTCAGFGGEFAYTYEVTQPAALLISTDHPETTLDTVVYLRAVCQQPESELACNDDGGTEFPRASVLSVPYVEPGLYYVIVDAFSPGSLGAFKVTVEERAPLGTACDPFDSEACVDGLHCREATPGAGSTCEYPVCSDGVDNDGDTYIDYPYDPGCSSPSDADETSPATLPQCADGLDNDSDGAVDFPDDDSCQAASDESEESCIESASIVDITYQPVIMGDTTGAGADQAGTCGNTAGAPDVVHRLTVPGMLQNLSVDTNGSTFDTVLYLRHGDCTASPIACDDDGGSGTQSAILLGNSLPGQYYLIVDGFGSDAGSYTLSVWGTIAPAQPCDPMQVSAGVFTCASGTACIDDGAGGTRCL